MAPMRRVLSFVLLLPKLVIKTIIRIKFKMIWFFSPQIIDYGVDTVGFVVAAQDGEQNCVEKRTCEDAMAGLKITYYKKIRLGI